MLTALLTSGPTSRRLTAALVVIAVIAVTALSLMTVAGPGAGAQDQPSVGTEIIEPVTGQPSLSFTDDGRPVIVYSNFDPAVPRVWLLVCSHLTCAGPPASNIAMPVTATSGVGTVIGTTAVVASQANNDPPIISRCDAATCLDGLIVSNLGGLTSNDASIVALERIDESVLILLTGSSEGTATSWLVECDLSTCEAPTVILDGIATSLSVGAGGAILVALTDIDATLDLFSCDVSRAEPDAALTCASPERVDDLAFSEIARGEVAPGRSALATIGNDGLPIVGVLATDQTITIAHCVTPACGTDADAAALRGAGATALAGVEVSSTTGPALQLLDLSTTANGTPVVSFVTADETAHVLTVPGCALAGCEGLRSTATVAAGLPAATIDIALGPAGGVHIVSDALLARLDNGDPDTAQMGIDYLHLCLACQCTIGTCAPQTIGDVCDSLDAGARASIEADVAEGRLHLVDVTLGGIETLGPDVILGSPFDDDLTAGPGDIVCAGSGNDLITFAASPGASAGVTIGVTMSGGSGDDVLKGSPGTDVIDGGPGADVIVGGDGNDSITDPSGNGRIWGGPGNDAIRAGGDPTSTYRIRGGPGDDVITAGPADDDLGGSAGNDLIFANGGADTVRGGTGDDRVVAGTGNDVLVAGNGGRDVVDGGAGDDQLITGGPRPDTVTGGPGDDEVKGNGGSDTLDGGPGNDLVLGGPQPDRLAGGAGTDECRGGTEVDSFDSCETAIQ